jgi:DNA-binding PadR family transcriptional regulator
MDLSRGAMTNRLDRLEAAGLIRRLPDPGDRRRVVVELTDHGRDTYRNAVGVQAKKEALVTAALNDREKVQLNALLRLLMLEFERREQTLSDVERDWMVDRDLPRARPHDGLEQVGGAAAAAAAANRRPGHHGDIDQPSRRWLHSTV